MQISTAPERFTDTETDAPVTHYEPDASRFDEVSIMRRDDQLVVRARDARTEAIVEKTFSIDDRMFRGAQPPGTEQRRDIDDDLLDILLLEGYCVADSGVQQY